MYIYSGDEKYKILKGKFQKLHSKYKQLKEQNEKQLTLNNALKTNLQDQAVAHENEIHELNNNFVIVRDELNDKINSKQQKMQQLVKEMNEQHGIIEQHNITRKKYESEAKKMQNKIDALHGELTQNKRTIDTLNDQVSQLQQSNDSLQSTIHSLK